MNQDKLNQKIIHELEQLALYCRAQGTTQNSLVQVFRFRCILIILPWLVFTGLLLLGVEFTEKVILSFICLIFICLLLEGLTPEAGLRFKQALAILAHNFLRDYGLREQELRAFITANPVVYTTEEVVSHFPEWIKEIYELTSDNFSPWVKAKISRAPSIERLLRERVWGSPQERKGILVSALILSKLDLKVDNLRLALMANSLMYFRMWGALPSLDKVPQWFRNYSEEEILRIFTSAAKETTIKDALVLADKYDLTFPVMKDFTDLYLWCEEYRDKSFKFPILPWSDLVGECELGEVVYLENAADLEYWSRELNNCLRSRQQLAAMGQCFILGIMQNGAPEIALELTPTGQLKEMRRGRNLSVTNHEQKVIYDLLRRCITPREGL